MLAFQLSVTLLALSSGKTSAVSNVSVFKVFHCFILSYEVYEKILCH